MFMAVIFICTSLPCTDDNIVDRIVTKVESANPATCLMQGEALLASTSIEIKDGDKVMVSCVRRR